MGFGPSPAARRPRATLPVVSAVIGAEGSADYDFVNTYQYNGFDGQMSQVIQQSYSGALPGDDTPTWWLRRRPRSRTTTPGSSRPSAAIRTHTTANLVATAAYTYDSAGQLMSIDYADGQSTPATLDNFTWTYDALGNVATSDSSLDAAGTVTYANDSTGQLTDGRGGQAPNESYPTTPTATAPIPATRPAGQRASLRRHLRLHVRRRRQGASPGAPSIRLGCNADGPCCRDGSGRFCHAARSGNKSKSSVRRHARLTRLAAAAKSLIRRTSAQNVPKEEPMASSRLFSSANGVSMRAYRGDSSVLMAFDLEERPAHDFAGFAIKCARHRESRFIC